MKKISVYIFMALTIMSFVACNNVENVGTDDVPSDSNSEYNSSLEPIETTTEATTTALTLHNPEETTSSPLQTTVTETGTSTVQTTSQNTASTTEYHETTATELTQPVSEHTTETSETFITIIQVEDQKKEIIELVNLERTKNNLQPLSTRSEINQIAEQRAEELAELFSDEHTRPDGRGYDTIVTDYGLEYSYVGENIAEGNVSVDEIMNEWLNSPSHRANILSPNYENMGVGIYEKGDEKYWVQFFYSSEKVTETTEFTETTVSTEPIRETTEETT